MSKYVLTVSGQAVFPSRPPVLSSPLISLLCPGCQGRPQCGAKGSVYGLCATSAITAFACFFSRQQKAPAVTRVGASNDRCLTLKNYLFQITASRVRSFLCLSYEARSDSILTRGLGQELQTNYTAKSGKGKTRGVLPHALSLRRCCSTLPRHWRERLDHALL